MSSENYDETFATRKECGGRGFEEALLHVHFSLIIRIDSLQVFFGWWNHFIFSLAISSLLLQWLLRLVSLTKKLQALSDLSEEDTTKFVNDLDTIKDTT